MNSMLLASSQGLLIVTALGFWALAKRAMPTADYNDGLVLINAIMLIGAVAKLNGDISLPATIARKGREATSILATTLTITAALAAVLGLGYHLLAGPVGWPQFPGGMVLLPLACGAWTVFTLQDGALAGVGRAELVPIENLIYGIARVAILLTVVSVFDETDRIGAIAMTIGWVAPLIVAIPVVLGYLFTRALPRSEGDSLDFDQDAAVVRADAAGSLFNQALFRLLPLAAYLIFDSEDQIAALGTAWLVFAVCDTFLSTIGTGLTIADPTELEASTREAARLSALSVLAMGIGFAVLAPLIMEVLVPGSAGREAVPLVRLIGLALVLRAPLHIVLARARTLGAARVLFGLQAVAGTLLFIGLAFGLQAKDLTIIGITLVFATLAVLPATWWVYRKAVPFGPARAGL